MASVDPPDVNKAFAEKENADFPLLSDPEKTVATAYGVVTPERQMASRWTFYIGPDGKIIDIDPKVSVRTAGEDLVKRLEALGVKRVRR